MIGSLSQLLPRLIPRDDHPMLEIRLFRKACLAASALCVLFILPVNLLQHLPVKLNLAVLAFGVFSFALYRMSLRGVHAIRTFSGLLALLLNFSWFMNAGSEGSIGMFMFAGILALNILFRGWTRWVLLGAFLANGLALFWMERAFPSLVVPYSHATDRQWDLMTGFVASTFACILILRVVLAAYDRERNRLAALNARLEQSLAEIRTLQGMLPICSWCKKIRDDAGLWTQVEHYLAEHTDVAFTHGMCPECAKSHFPNRQAGDAGQPERDPAAPDEPPGRT